MPNSFFSWLVESRASPRSAFTLRLACMAASVVLSLVWTRVLLHTLGAHDFGLLSSFTAFIAIACACDFGMGAAVSLRTNRLVAAGDGDGLRRFHAVAQTAFLAVAIVSAAVCLALAPWLPEWLHFAPTEARGSLAPLFAIGALSAGLSIYSSYLVNSAYGAGTVSWGILPGFLITQTSMGAQVIFCALGAPLWALQVVAVVLAAANVWISLLIFHHSHPIFRHRLPFLLEWRELRELGQTSFWAYLFAIFTLIYSATDRLIINAFFGADAVAVFHLNSRLPELALAVVATAAFAGIPKVTNLMLARNPEQAARGGELAARLAQAQSFLAIAGVLFYLLINDFFVRWIFGPAFLSPLDLQFAFGAAVLLVANGDIYLNLASRLSDEGLRLTGAALLGAGLLNLLLSIAAAKYLHWMAGVGWATFAAQLLLFGVVTRHVRRRYAFRQLPSILLRSLVAPFATYAVACGLKLWLGRSGPLGFLAMGVLCVALLALYSVLAGPTPAELWRDWQRAWHALARRVRPGAQPPELVTDPSHPASAP